MNWKNLTIEANKLLDFSDKINRSFYIHGIDVSSIDESIEYPDFTLVLSNNKDDFNLNKGDFFIEFEKDKNAKGYYISKMKKECKSYRYAFIFSSFPLGAANIKMFYRFK